jgi:hypothetical protein
MHIKVTLLRSERVSRYPCGRFPIKLSPQGAGDATVDSDLQNPMITLQYQDCSRIKLTVLNTNHQILETSKTFSRSDIICTLFFFATDYQHRFFRHEYKTLGKAWFQKLFIGSALVVFNNDKIRIPVYNKLCHLLNNIGG